MYSVLFNTSFLRVRMGSSNNHYNFPQKENHPKYVLLQGSRFYSAFIL